MLLVFRAVNCNPVHKEQEITNITTNKNHWLMDVDGCWWMLVDVGGCWWMLVDVGGVYSRAQLGNEHCSLLKSAMLMMNVLFPKSLIC